MLFIPLGMINDSLAQCSEQTRLQCFKHLKPITPLADQFPIEFSLKVHKAGGVLTILIGFHWLGNHLHTDHQVLIGLEWSEGMKQQIPDETAVMETSFT